MNKFQRGDFVKVTFKDDNGDVIKRIEATIIGYYTQADKYMYNLRVPNFSSLGLSLPYLTRVPEDEISIDICAYDYMKLKPIKILYNDPATVVFWNDGTKTVVKRVKGEKSSKYVAFCAALAKRVYGTNSHLSKIVESGEDICKKGKKTCKNK